MGFGPPPPIHVGKLTKATPTPFDEATLSKQLEDIGLSCAILKGQNLNQYINEVSSQLQEGTVQSMAIKAPSQQVDIAQLQALDNVTSLAAAMPSQVEVATGNWTINDEAEGFTPQLEVIQYPTHFEWLYANRATNGFTGVIDFPAAQTGNYPNAAAIQKLFVDSGVTASSTIVKGLDKRSMLAALTRVISPLTNEDLTNYLVPDPGKPWPSLVVYLVDNYNTNTGDADGIGVLFSSWTLKITDWKRKTKHGGDTHPTTFQIKAGSVLYGSPDALCADYKAVLDQFGIKTGAPKCPPT